MKLENLADHFRVDQPDKFRLKDIDPGDTFGLDIGKDEARGMLGDSVKRMAKLQEKLYAQDRWSVLLIFQAMDAAGKDGAIQHVMSGINPQGCQVFSFKAPSPQELDHDFMWRTTMCLPERGRIGVFNRSYYEEVLVVRAHPDILAKQRLPEKLVTKDIWDQRFEDIRAFEKYIARNGTLVLKFMLHVSKDEQARRFLERLDEPEKNWKFSLRDVEERELWDEYMHFYEDCIRETSRPYAPWFVVPADNKWFTRLVISSAIVEAMDALDLKYPKVDPSALAKMQSARTALAAELPKGKNGKPAKG
jgi:PPK2 family polyphosphate:nucleotide phosphotransferase